MLSEYCPFHEWNKSNHSRLKCKICCWTTWRRNYKIVHQCSNNWMSYTFYSLALRDRSLFISRGEPANWKMAPEKIAYPPPFSKHRKILTPLSLKYQKKSTTFAFCSLHKTLGRLSCFMYSFTICISGPFTASVMVWTLVHCWRL